MGHIEAFLDKNSKGRKSGRPVVLRPFVNDYRQLADHVIVYRMADKRQVFGQGNENSRFSHTITVIRVARAIARRLGLNEDLVSAISLAHDVAHCPFAHLGETVLSRHLNALGFPKYDHAMVAPYVLQSVCGLDLSYEVLEGITFHSFSSGVLMSEVPAEYRVAAIGDKTYVIDDTYDIVQIMSSGQWQEVMPMSLEDHERLRVLIRRARMMLGQSQRERYDHFVQAVVDESLKAGEVSFGNSEATRPFQDLIRIHASEIYPRTDLASDEALLERVIGRLITSSIPGNPYLLFALLTDAELLYVDQFEAGQMTQNDLNVIVAGQFTLPARDEFDFLTPDLGWASR